MKFLLIALCLIGLAPGAALALGESEEIFALQPREPRLPFDARVGSVDSTYRGTRMVVAVEYRGIEMNGRPGDKTVLFQMDGEVVISRTDDGLAVPVFDISITPLKVINGRKHEDDYELYLTVGNAEITREADLDQNIRASIYALGGGFSSNEGGVVEVFADLLGYAYNNYKDGEGSNRGVHSLSLFRLGASLAKFDAAYAMFGQTIHFKMRPANATVNFDYSGQGGIRSTTDLWGDYSLALRRGKMELLIFNKLGARLVGLPDNNEHRDRVGYGYVEFGIGGRF